MTGGGLHMLIFIIQHIDIISGLALVGIEAVHDSTTIGILHTDHMEWGITMVIMMDSTMACMEDMEIIMVDTMAELA